MNLKLFAPFDYDEWEVRWLLQDSNWVLVFLLFLVPLALWFFWTSLQRVPSRPKKIFLFCLRLLCFVLLILVLSHPEIEFKKRDILKNTVAVLLDDSMSLSIKALDRQRIDLVRDILEKQRDFFAALKEKFRVDFYFVSDRITSVPESSVESKYSPRGMNTDLNRVLLDVKKLYEGKSLTSVLLFSDGADLAQEPPEISTEMAETLARFSAPINAFQAGTNERFMDLGIEHVEKPDFGFIQQPVNLTVTLTASSMGNKRIPLVLRKEGKILVSKVIDITAERSRYKVDLQFTPTSLGRQIYSLSVPLFADESIEMNNSRDFQVNVVRDRVRILHLNGRPSWDSRYLREVLVNNPKVDLLSFFILRTLSDDVEAATDELSLIPFPSNLLFTDYLNSFDIVIFQNFQFAPFVDKKYLENIKNYVENGGAFIMIGGDLSFQGGGYENTPIEELLPVSLKKMEKNLIEDEFQFQEAKTFANHPVLRLEKEDGLNQSAWKTMSPLNGLNTGLLPKKNAQVLSSFARSGNESAYPVLVAGKAGKGRSLVLATDTSWNWNFRRVGKGGSGRYYQKFWNNVIAWMIADPETHNLQIETDKGGYGTDEKVLIKFKVLQESFNPWPDKKVRLAVYSSPGRREVLEQTLETDKNGEGSFQFLPAREGLYWARLEVRDKEIQANEVGFSVFSDTAEFQKPMINGDLLEAMAKTTGGVYQVLNDSTDMNKLALPNPKVYINVRSEVIALWDNWWSYGFMLAFLCAEWLVRRKSGLS